MKETEIIERAFLQQLRSAALGMASGNLNPLWARAYLALADAADKLDAMQARSTVSAQGNWHECVPPTETPAAVV